MKANFIISKQKLSFSHNNSRQKLFSSLTLKNFLKSVPKKNLKSKLRKLRALSFLSMRWEMSRKPASFQDNFLNPSNLYFYYNTTDPNWLFQWSWGRIDFFEGGTNVYLRVFFGCCTAWWRFRRNIACIRLNGTLNLKVRPIALLKALKSAKTESSLE